VSIMRGDTYYVLRVDCTGCAERWPINSRSRIIPLPPFPPYIYLSLFLFIISGRNASLGGEEVKREKKRDRGRRRLLLVIIVVSWLA